MSAASRRGMLIAAGALLAVALVWLVLLEAKSPVRALCGRLKDYGYHLSPGDFYLRGYGTDTSISALLENDGVTREEAERLAGLSRRCGFDGDIDKTGRVELLMWQKAENEVLLVYMADGVPELAFIEVLPDGEAMPIDTE